MSNGRTLVYPKVFEGHPWPAAQAMRDGWWTGVVDRVHDGDTLFCLLWKGLFDVQMVKVRLAGAWAPELTEAGGIASRDAVSAFALGRFAAVRPHYGRTGTEVMSFDRFVCDVMIWHGTTRTDLAGWAVHQGYATLQRVALANDRPEAG